MPAGEDLDRLLPRQVGAFVREPIQPQAKGTPIYGNYRCGSATVFVELGICVDANDTHMALETAKGETSGEFPVAPQVYVQCGDVRCWRTVSPGGAFVAWTRGRYYFSAHAKGGAKDLDEFMAAFPY